MKPEHFVAGFFPWLAGIIAGQGGVDRFRHATVGGNKGEADIDQASQIADDKRGAFQRGHEDFGVNPLAVAVVEDRILVGILRGDVRADRVQYMPKISLRM